MRDRTSGQSDRSSAPSPDLAIGDLAERTDIPVATLRTWESRYGVPRPTRLAGGHRRFVDSDVDLVREISRLRSTGLSMSAAVAAAATAGEMPEPSLFAALRRRHPGLQTRVLRKRTLLALTQAMEDEACSRADRPLLFAGFQQERWYRQSQARWVELARTADAAVVFADFPRHSAVNERPVRVALPGAAALRREWLLVCDDPHHAACLVGSEVPGQTRINDQDRRFETLWTLDPRVVRDAARVCARLAVSLKPQVQSRLGNRLVASLPEGSADLGRAEALFGRLVDRFDSF